MTKTTVQQFMCSWMNATCGVKRRRHREISKNKVISSAGQLIRTTDFRVNWRHPELVSVFKQQRGFLLIISVCLLHAVFVIPLKLKIHIRFIYDCMLHALFSVIMWKRDWMNNKFVLLWDFSINVLHHLTRVYLTQFLAFMGNITQVSVYCFQGQTDWVMILILTTMLHKLNQSQCLNLIISLQYRTSSELLLGSLHSILKVIVDLFCCDFLMFKVMWHLLIFNHNQTHWLPYLESYLYINAMLLNYELTCLPLKRLHTNPEKEIFCFLYWKTHKIYIKMRNT